MTTRPTLEALGARNPVDWTPDPGESWEPVNLANFVLDEDGELLAPPVPLPDIFARDDGAGMLYPGKAGDLYGPSESCKTWLALAAGKSALVKPGGRFLFCDYEDVGPVEVVDRLHRLGASIDQIFDGLTYVQPTGPPVGRQWEALVYQSYDLAVIDSVGGAIAEMGGDSSNNGDVLLFNKTVVAPLTECGSAVLLVDHSGHGSNRVIGAMAKKSVLTGASFRVEAITPLIPGGIGRVDLFVMKDRPGAVRQVSGPRRKDGSQHAARVVLDATDPANITTTITAPTVITSAAADNTADTARTEYVAERSRSLFERVARVAEQHPGASQNALAKAVGGERAEVLAVIRSLIDGGYLATEPGPGRAVLHRSIRPYPGCSEVSPK